MPGIRYLTKEQMAKVDELAVNEYMLSIDQMMENAGRNFARFVAKLKPKKVIVFFGKGNNGGDGVAAARHLTIMGIKVNLIAASKDMNEHVFHQLAILAKAGIKPQKSFRAHEGDIIIDALFGYNFEGYPRGRYADLIKGINFAKQAGVKVVSFDLPSGMNPDTGKGKLMVDADYVVTLALPKKGLKKIKNVYVANLGIPNELYKDIGVRVGNIFEKSDVVRVS